MDWYGPNDEWPEHSKQYFRDALKYAQNAGWWFRKFEGHSFGIVICDQEMPKGDRCEYLVFSTGRGSEANARTLRSRVDRCPHRKGGSPASAVAIATELLDEAELLIEAAQACMTAADKQARTDELLALAAQQTAQAEETLNSALHLDEASRHDMSRANDLAESVGYHHPADGSLAPEPLLETADDRAALAQQTLKKPGSSRSRVRVRQRAREIRARIRALRAQLG
ncbi:MAG: hypothetical protein J2P25_00760 [Nocardiopsaceae bacterium]|nr:hypothetical protein [Nocardiopsaceae bacterium]